MKKTSLLIIALALVSALTAGHQAILDVADSLFAEGSHYAAITEYKRFASYAGVGEVPGFVFLKIANASRELGDFQTAVGYADKAVYAAESDSLRAHYRVEKAMILMSAQNLSLAEFILFREANTGRFPGVRARAIHLLALNYILQAKWTEAESAIGRIAALSHLEDDPHLNALLALLRENSLAEPLDPALAKRLSSWLPGLGQFYSGDIRNDLNSFALNAAAIWWLADTALRSQYFGLVPIALIGWKYYQGGRARAALIATQTNEERTRAGITAAANLYGALLQKLNPVW